MNLAVIGTLSAPNHALFVSHRHPEGHVSNAFQSQNVRISKMGNLQAHFSVYAIFGTGMGRATFVNHVTPTQTNTSSVDVMPVLAYPQHFSSPLEQREIGYFESSCQLL